VLYERLVYEELKMYVNMRCIVSSPNEHHIQSSLIRDIKGGAGTGILPWATKRDSAHSRKALPAC